MEPIPGFNLRAQVVGHGGSYVKHIQQETRCRVQIKGRGSGFMEHSTGAESDEPMYLHVAGPDPKEVTKAKELCEDLLGNVREQYERFKANPPPQRMESYTDGYGANANNSSYGGREYHGRDSYGGGRGRDSYSSQSRDNYGSSYSPAASAPAAPGTAASLGDYAAQYAQYYGASAGAGAAAGGADPYAAYGGYQNYVAYYQYYAQQQAQQQGQAPPPPPGGENAPPPPPGGSSYGAVPPPPGL
jgi:KH domain